MDPINLDELPSHLLTGKRGEDLAAEYLRRKGWTIEKRNFDVAIGELDIIATRGAEGGTLVAVVEVKSRKAGSRSRSPIALSVTAQKRHKIIGATRLYADQYGDRHRGYRFDVITVDFSCEPPEIAHYEGAFDAKGKPY